MRYKTQKNLHRAIQMIQDKGYDLHTATHLANHGFQLVKRHRQSVEELIQVIEPLKSAK